MLEHIETLKDLHCLAFGDSKAYANFFFQHRFSPANTFLHFEGGAPVGALYSRDFALRILGTAWQVPFFNGIATHPNHRYQGIAAALVKEAIATYGKRGYPLVMLHPFLVSFYEKLSFAPINYVKKQVVRFAKNSRYHEVPYPVSNPVTDAEAAPIYNLYQAAAARHPAHRVRTLAEMRDILQEITQDGGSVFQIHKNGTPYGYFFGDHKTIYEYVGGTKAALFACPFAKGKKVSFLHPNGEPYSMAAVCNVEKLFGMVPYQADGTFYFTYEHTNYILQVANKKLVTFGKTNQPPQFGLDSPTLARLALGDQAHVQNAAIPPHFLQLFPTFHLYMLEKY